MVISFKRQGVYRLGSDILIVDIPLALCILIRSHIYEL